MGQPQDPSELLFFALSCFAYKRINALLWGAKYPIPFIGEIAVLLGFPALWALSFFLSCFKQGFLILWAVAVLLILDYR